MSIENLEKMINWDLVDEERIGALVSEDSIILMKAAPNYSRCAGFKYIPRPRVFEDGASYPVKTENGVRDTALYRDKGYFYITGVRTAYSEDDFQLIGKKLPDSLWEE